MSKPSQISLLCAVIRGPILWWCAVSLPCSLMGQEAASFVPGSPRDSVVVTVSPALKDSLLQLPHQFILAGSDSVTLASGQALQRGIDYRMDYRYGTMHLTQAMLQKAVADSAFGKGMTIRFAYLPFHFQESYYKRKMVVLRDSTGKDSIKISKLHSAFSVEDIFGQNLQKSGSIVRGFTVGSNRDLSLNSGLRLQLQGKIASDLEVVAALTDENTPIQPEGTTQTLQEFDKVFVEMRGTDFTATLGDFDLNLAGTEFAALNRKLQGAKGTADYHLGVTKGSILVSGAVPRGKYNTNQFQGLEGVQGPYRLAGKNGEPNIVIIAGTEKVYIDGEMQIRGETNDYTIDYSVAEVTFTTRRLITAASRITIDFEYTDRQYNRSLLAAQTSSGVFDNKATLTVSYYREADNQDAPIDIAITDSARHVLERAGNDRNKAVLSGVTQVDSNGTYILIDTLLAGGQHVQFYRYAPGRTAPYHVVFSSVGFGRGDYVRQSIGVFVWQGPGAGDYLPIQYLPLPQLEQTADIRLDVTPTSDLKVTGEWATSSFDANRFSTLGDENNTGHALNFSAGYAPREVRIGGSNIGAFDLQLKERYINKRFTFIDRVNDIEFNRKWGIDSTTNANEEMQEASLKYLPLPQIAVGGGYGRIDRGSDLNSKRVNGSVDIKGAGIPSVAYTVEHIRSDQGVTDNSSSWLRSRGHFEDALGSFTPGFRYEGEKRSISSISTSALKPGSFRYDLFAPGLKVRDIGPVSVLGELEWRHDDLFNEGSVIRVSKSFTQTYGAKLAEWNSLTSSVDVTLRNKTYSQVFRQLGNSDVKTVLIRSQSRATPFNRGLESDLFYEVSTERSSRLERVFVHVAQGTGNYHYLGDLNNNGVADENEFELARFDGDYVAITLPSDQLFPIIDLKTSVRFRITPKQFLKNADDPFSRVLSALSSESYVRVDEKSSEPDLKQIYFLHFRKFQNDSTTIAGSTLFTQDLNVLEGSPDVSVRLRYSQRTGLNRFTSGIERSYARERSIRLRVQLVKEIANQFDYSNRIDRVNSNGPSNQLRDILSNSVVYDLSYRPEQDLELGLKTEVGTSTDRFPVPELVADLNTQSVRFVYAFSGAGQLRIETSREEVRLNRAIDVFPFELTGGRVDGKTWLWNVSFDYRVTEFIQATINYDGRSEGGNAPVHTARAEVRAFF